MARGEMVTVPQREYDALEACAEALERIMDSPVGPHWGRVAGEALRELARARGGHTEPDEACEACR